MKAAPFILRICDIEGEWEHLIEFDNIIRCIGEATALITARTIEADVIDTTGEKVKIVKLIFPK